MVKSVNVDAVKREVKKLAKEVHKAIPLNESHAELPAGAVQRASPLEQEMGTRKYKEMIHDHNTKNKHILDRLPFTFLPKKKIRSSMSVLLECPECGKHAVGSEFTIGLICTGCKKFVSPANVEAENRGHNPDLKVGIFGTASDKLELLEKRNKK